MINRYMRANMAELWSAKTKYNLWKDIELIALRTLYESGKIHEAHESDVYRCLSMGHLTDYDISAIEKLEKETKHDVVAFIRFMESRMGPMARYLHYGLTSSDIVDTAFAITLSEAGYHITTELYKVQRAIRCKADQHKYSLMIGRSHGMHAEPITFGLKLASWYAELDRHVARLNDAIEQISVCKASGSMGTYAHCSPEIETALHSEYGMSAPLISNQIIQRDRHAHFFTTLALIGSSLEKFATEIRHLQRSELAEVQEPYGNKQKGSSSMPHKRNPIMSENICGLSRLLRGYALSAMEDVALWHERDISHSSVERVIGPDATSVLDYMLDKFAYIVETMQVNTSTMLDAVVDSEISIHSQRVMLELIDAGVRRYQAHDIVQCIMFGKPTSEELVSRLQDEFAKHGIRNVNADNIIGRCDLSSYEYYTKHVDTIFKRVFGE